MMLIRSAVVFRISRLFCSPGVCSGKDNILIFEIIGTGFIFPDEDQPDMAFDSFFLKIFSFYVFIHEKNHQLIEKE